METKTVKQNLTADPVLDYFKGLPQWDNFDHIGKLARYVKTPGHPYHPDPPYFNEEFRKCLMRCAGTAVSDKINPVVFILASMEEGIGKSTFVQFLNPMGLDCYTTREVIDRKDLTITLSETFIWNLDDRLQSHNHGKITSIIRNKIILSSEPNTGSEIQPPMRTSFFGTEVQDRLPLSCLAEYEIDDIKVSRSEERRVG